MLISCVLSYKDIGNQSPDLIVLPEYSCLSEVEEAATKFPKAVIVAAHEENGMCRAYLGQGGTKKIDYLKVTHDGTLKGSKKCDQKSVQRFGEVGIGVVICLDICECPKFLDKVVCDLKSLSTKYKILCIPARMDSSAGWRLPLNTRQFDEYVVFCNNIVKGDELRLCSYIAKGKDYMRQQKCEEAICYSLP